MNHSIIKIAYADDHTCVRQGIVALLERQENIHVIAEAPNGEELLDQFHKLDTLPDVVLLDINMPVKDGYETTAEIRHKYPSVRIIAFSLYRDEFCIIKMIKCGAIGFLDKGRNSIEEICAAIKCVAVNGYYFSDRIGRGFFERAYHTVMPELTDRERQFLILYCDGLSNRDIGDKMFVSHRTIEHYYDSTRKKLGASSRVELVVFAIRNGIVPIC